MLQMDDQGLVNTDPRFIATSTHINNVPTDVRGLTFSRTPQQVTSVTHWWFCCCTSTEIRMVVAVKPWPGLTKDWNASSHSISQMCMVCV